MREHMIHCLLGAALLIVSAQISGHEASITEPYSGVNSPHLTVKERLKYIWGNRVAAGSPGVKSAEVWYTVYERVCDYHVNKSVCGAITRRETVHLGRATEKTGAAPAVDAELAGNLGIVCKVPITYEQVRMYDNDPEGALVRTMATVWAGAMNDTKRLWTTNINAEYSPGSYVFKIGYEDNESVQYGNAWGTRYYVCIEQIPI